MNNKSISPHPAADLNMKPTLPSPCTAPPSPHTVWRRIQDRVRTSLHSAYHFCQPLAGAALSAVKDAWSVPASALCQKFIQTHAKKQLKQLLKLVETVIIGYLSRRWPGSEFIVPTITDSIKGLAKPYIKAFSKSLTKPSEDDRKTSQKPPRSRAVASKHKTSKSRRRAYDEDGGLGEKQSGAGPKMREGWEGEGDGGRGKKPGTKKNLACKVRGGVIVVRIRRVLPRQLRT
ncbi:uncharacterized protein B0I36DRAFT_46842 [Microdochium trichocladiopsis]|uniref:Uncharacterized protein n=1 Tax=Microdochium trichocladiopsis TaxID=1682393 RepID=A0A9P8XTI5_9PEZI|nr:uncharacterized protein B0I36DRAFT_46842 [Microdochium trichocladiopsis]KAH7016487.1 hypothetical protein B0I36DRAFT_46842 [Microdochium trichocladiopsis]